MESGESVIRAGSDAGGHGGSGRLPKLDFETSKGIVGRRLLLVAALGVLAATWVLPPLAVALVVGVVGLVGLTLRYPVAGMVVLALAVPWAGEASLVPGGILITLVDLVVVGLGVAWLVDAAANRRSIVSTWIWTPYLGLFFLAVLLSATQAVDRHAALNEIVKWAELIVVYLAATSFIRTRLQMRFLVAALVVAGVSQALFGYYQFLFSYGPQAFIEHRLFLRAYGSFDQPNPFAGYLNLILPLAVAMAAYSRGAERRLYALAAVLLEGAVLASQSRGALLAGLVALIVMWCLLTPRVRPVVWSSVLAGLLAAWLATFGLVPTSPFARLLAVVGLGDVSFGSVTNSNFSAVERAAHWLAGVRMFAAHPILGVGIGNYSAAYPAYHPRGWYASLEHAHNYYINIAAEAGIVGLASYLLVAGTALWYSYASFRRASDRVQRAAVLGVLGALVAISFHNLFDVLYVHGMVALLGLLMALVATSPALDVEPGTGRQQGTSGSDGIRVRRTGRVV